MTSWPIVFYLIPIYTEKVRFVSHLINTNSAIYHLNCESRRGFEYKFSDWFMGHLTGFLTSVASCAKKDKEFVYHKLNDMEKRKLCINDINGSNVLAIYFLIT